MCSPVRSPDRDLASPSRCLPPIWLLHRWILHMLGIDFVRLSSWNYLRALRHPLHRTRLLPRRLLHTCLVLSISISLCVFMLYFIVSVWCWICYPTVNFHCNYVMLSLSYLELIKILKRFASIPVVYQLFTSNYIINSYIRVYVCYVFHVFMNLKVAFWERRIRIWWNWSSSSSSLKFHLILLGFWFWRMDPILLNMGHA